jgi:hypothetical protein
MPDFPNYDRDGRSLVGGRGRRGFVKLADEVERTGLPAASIIDRQEVIVDRIGGEGGALDRTRNRIQDLKDAGATDTEDAQWWLGDHERSMSVGLSRLYDTLDEQTADWQWHTRQLQIWQAQYTEATGPLPVFSAGSFAGDDTGGLYDGQQRRTTR